MGIAFVSMNVVPIFFMDFIRSFFVMGFPFNNITFIPDICFISQNVIIFKIMFWPGRKTYTNV